MTPTEVEKALDDLIDSHSAEIQNEIEKIESLALAQVDTITVNSNGDIVAPSRSMPEAKAASKIIVRDVDLRFESVTNQVIQDFALIEAIVATVYNTEINDTNLRSLIAISKTTFNDYKSISKDTANRLNKAIIDFSVAGMSRDDLKTEIKGILTGSSDVKGVPMSVRANQFTQDSIMRYHNAANLAVAEQVGVKKFKYYGNIMATTRPFCVSHVGEIKTKEAWENIGRNQSWKGKASSNIFIDVGGYNCRHHLTPVF